MADSVRDASARLVGLPDSLAEAFRVVTGRGTHRLATAHMPERVHGGHEVCAVGEAAGTSRLPRFRVQINTLSSSMYLFAQVNT